jgi:beta-lactamase regulating signal transducer with metallopeptidase domain
VRLSAAVATPVTFGTTILLPAECRDCSPMKRQAVLAHERSHVVRGDFYVLLLATLHRALFWFSPFSWWLLNELAETAELISDDATIEILGRPASLCRNPSRCCGECSPDCGGDCNGAHP